MSHTHQPKKGRTGKGGFHPARLELPERPKNTGLPKNTLLTIMANLRDAAAQSDYAALCQTSTATHESGIRHLFKSPHLKVYGGTTYSLSAFRSSVLGSRKHALLVEEIHIQLCNPDFPSEERQLWRHTPYFLLDQFKHLTDILKVCFHVTSLVIDHPYPVPESVVEELTKAICHLRDPKLQHLEFNVHDDKWLDRHIPGDTSVNESLIARARGVPSLKSLALTLQQGPESILPIPFPPGAGKNLQSLSINKAYFTMDYLRNTLQDLTELKELNLSYSWFADTKNEHVGDYLDCRELGQALATLQPTLESLKIAIKFKSRTALDVETGSTKDSTWGLLHDLGSLRSFSRLKSLELSPEVLLGWDVEDDGTIEELAAVLPDSLRRLHLRYDFRSWEYSPWDFDPICNSLIKLLDESGSPALESVTVTAWDDEVEQKETPLGLLVDKCRDLGITFHLDTIPNDWRFRSCLWH